jgi:chorismate mutase
MTESDPAQARLEALRARIEQLDQEIVRLIGERTRIAREARDAKHDAGLPLFDPAREAVVVRRAANLARAAGLPEEPVRELFWRLIGLSRSVQADGGAGDRSIDG